MTMQGAWAAIGRLDDIPRRGARCVTSPLGRIAVFRTMDDKVFATEDRCPHKGGPLSQGIVHGGSVTCPLHSQVIALDTGLVQGPDEGRVRTFPVRVGADGALEILLEAEAFQEAAE
ncbi:nitrite reductase small subunit NirD [Aureimonas phyllosphaerae]|uniref:Nitrite reductase (NADH) small subunit n=1 Tax=Aureimonas phyllosphaerae TaxID=1166078 RepID=A0A7W6BUV3_9HYPH|nr:nitrite reductase small subunit NirD [Aureimonas phyllosphaerae]MBB3936474.1 nitrite reductase (NADH) small subunit [Aureimonas phyllosphaerae]MBB3960662.1 nitrite reductase (NADH) small subunit [Aureimonas phyllosphaerae]SFF29746.1 assimilatory nitrite reductase (NAD(P)H) small subunit [Aureimonas phyllosphaerae]